MHGRLPPRGVLHSRPASFSREGRSPGSGIGPTNQEQAEIDFKFEERLRIVEALVRELVEGMELQDAAWRERSDAAMKLILSRLDEMSGRGRLDQDALRESAA